MVVCTKHCDSLDGPEDDERNIVDTRREDDKEHAEERAWRLDHAAREERILRAEEFPCHKHKHERKSQQQEGQNMRRGPRILLPAQAKCEENKDQASGQQGAADKVNAGDEFAAGQA